MKNNLPAEIPQKKKGKVREYIEAIAIAVVIALFIRSFGIEAFKIPSTSMVPTLLVGDHIFVNKFIYGLRIPFTTIRFLTFRDPKHGEVIVFRPPVEKKNYIKRVIGLPGDTVRAEGTDLFVNGERISHELLEARDYLLISEEVTEGLKVVVQYENYPFHLGGSFRVPADHLFVMGDNRDNSADSRKWGFVPLRNVKGQALFVWLSLDRDHRRIRWERFGKWIH